MDKRYPGPEKIKRIQLPNGITILAYENFSSQSVVLHGLLRAGAIFESPTKAGLSDFTGELLMRGTESYSFDQIYDKLESSGVALGIGSGRHVTTFSGSGLAEDLDLILQMLTSAIREPSFPTHQIERVRGQIQTGFQIRANDTQQMAGLKFMETLYRDHPYGHSVHGYPDTVNALVRQDLVEFHREHYGPQGMIIAIVGAVPVSAVVDKVQAHLGDWVNPNQRTYPVIPDAPRPTQTIRVDTRIPGKAQADIVIGLPGPRRNAPDYLHASMMNTILGVFGMMGRIGQVVREDLGLAYYASSNMSGGLGPSPWTAGAGVAPENIELAIEAIIAEIDRIRESPVADEELEDVKSYRIGSLPVGLETNGSMATVFVDMELYDLGLDFLQRLPDELRQISIGDIQLAAQKYLSSQQLVISAAGTF